MRKNLVVTEKCRIFAALILNKYFEGRDLIDLHIDQEIKANIGFR